MQIQDLFKKLIDWFLGKAPPRLETFEEERIESDYCTLIRYRRKTHRAYRTWRAVYKTLEYDLVFGWDTLAYLPDVPNVHKQSRLSTHAVHIYKQGLHARYNPKRKCHEPDIKSLLQNECCLEPIYAPIVLQKWRLKTAKSKNPVLTTEDLVERIIDKVAMRAIEIHPSQQDPLEVDWKAAIEKTTREMLFSPGHEVFPSPRDNQGDGWV